MNTHLFLFIPYSPNSTNSSNNRQVPTPRTEHCLSSRSLAVNSICGEELNVPPSVRVKNSYNAKWPLPSPRSADVENRIKTKRKPTPVMSLRSTRIVNALSTLLCVSMKAFRVNGGSSRVNPIV